MFCEKIIAETEQEVLRFKVALDIDVDFKLEREVAYSEVDQKNVKWIYKREDYW